MGIRAHTEQLMQTRTGAKIEKGSNIHLVYYEWHRSCRWWCGYCWCSSITRLALSFTSIFCSSAPSTKRAPFCIWNQCCAWSFKPCCWLPNCVKLLINMSAMLAGGTRTPNKSDCVYNLLCSCKWSKAICCVPCARVEQRKRDKERSPYYLRKRREKYEMMHCSLSVWKRSAKQSYGKYLSAW